VILRFHVSSEMAVPEQASQCQQVRRYVVAVESWPYAEVRRRRHDPDKRNRNGLRQDSVSNVVAGCTACEFLGRSDCRESSSSPEGVGQRLVGVVVTATTAGVATWE
jgi:hypothetical protein